MIIKNHDEKGTNKYLSPSNVTDIILVTSTRII